MSLLSNKFLHGRELTDEQVREVQEAGLATGSRAFGVETAASDWDVVVLQLPASIPRDWIAYNADETYLRNGLSFISAKFKRAGTTQVINIILALTEDEFKRWEYATAEMLKLPKQNLYAKSSRVALFEAFKLAYRPEHKEI